MNQHQEITACAFLYNSDSKLFIVKRAASKKFLPTIWELIGGHTEFGESLEESLMREIREEIHVEVNVENPYYAFTYVSTHTVEVDFLAKLTDNCQFVTLNPNDHSECRWISESEVDNYFPVDDQERTAVIRGFKMIKRFI
jgi:8-oxo-dGTP diphosphatase